MRKLILAAFAATLFAAPMVAAAKAGDANDSAAPTLKTCSAKWKGFTQAEKDAYKTKAEGKTSKSGRKLSGYNVFTSECFKHEG
jgi:Ni/Co efflux regulator RcnB